ncbi:MAG: hypothetical protein KKD28_11370 [Chloroflexi bacterium]|nr:hypothetical protein [Chloroflexota bacterium]
MTHHKMLSRNALAAVLREAYLWDGGEDAAGSIFEIARHLLFYHYQILI